MSTQEEQFLDPDEDPTCGTCGEYAEDGYLCDQCRSYEESMVQCSVHCGDKIHHAASESAADHVASLVADDCPNAYAYECEFDVCEWDCRDSSGHHWHVASSTIPRRIRSRVGGVMSTTALLNVGEVSLRNSDTSACEACAFAAEHQRWPMTAGTHCRDCHRSWVSTAQAHCTVCHQSFASNSVADLHWREPKGQPPVHLDPSTITRLELHDEAMGQVWRSTGGRQSRQFALYAERGDISALQCSDVVPDSWEASQRPVGAST
jgi:hypothetical protein